MSPIARNLCSIDEPRRRAGRFGRRRAWIVVLALVVLLPVGCVRRRLVVRSNPPGALVYVDNQQIGTTPCGVDFTYYGTREIRLVKPGYETLTVNQPIPTPWYQVPPLDFISENLVPNKIRDNRTVSFNLSPQVMVPTPQLLDRAGELRQQAQSEPVVPAGAVVAPGAPIQPAPSLVVPGTRVPSTNAAPTPTPLPPTGNPPTIFTP